jgi:hypothetical protein
MADKAAFLAVFYVAFAGLILSFCIERLLRPSPVLAARPFSAWRLHGGLWTLAFCVLVLATGRPWFAAAGVSAILLLLVLVSNAKFKSLREPFVWQDYWYFSHALRYPRLYLPFLGWGRGMAAALGLLLAVLSGLVLEQAPAGRFSPTGQTGGVLILIAAGLLLLIVGERRSSPLTLEADRDLVNHGLLACLWRYAIAGRKPPRVTGPFAASIRSETDASLPDLIAVQSESFFDPRPLFAGIRGDALTEFDRLKDASMAHGRLKVPAWGANTVRTEFAFLSGLNEDDLGIHRFNPYLPILAGWRPRALPLLLKDLGYRTVCIHPYHSGFYRRNRVYPLLGFDEFLDIRAFAGAERRGPYVSDAAVMAKLEGLLDRAGGPLFVFVITMENHGPLHLEKVRGADLADLFTTPPPSGCDDLTIYLRHLRNADRMIGALRQRLDRHHRPAGLCWFGDHVPIMPGVYARFGAPPPEVEYAIWVNGDNSRAPEQTRRAHELATCWLGAVNLAHLVR